MLETAGPDINRLTSLGLTLRQARVFAFLLTSTMRDGFQPSFEETCKALGFVSKTAVLVHLQALRRKGWIGSGAPGVTRSIRFRRRLDGGEFRGFVCREDD